MKKKTLKEKGNKAKKLNSEAVKTSGITTTGNKLLSFARNNWKVIVFWGLAIVSLATIVAFGASTAGSYAKGQQIEITYAVTPDINQLQELLNSQSIQYQSIKIDGGNVVKVALGDSQNSQENLKKFISSLEGDKYLSKNAYQLFPQNIIETYLLRMTTAVIFLIILSGIAIAWLARAEGWLYRLRMWAAYLIVPAVLAILLTAAGIIVSKLTSLTLNPAVFELYQIALVSFILVWSYVIYMPTYRKVVLDFIFGE